MGELTPLNQENLSKIGKQISVPTYDRSPDKAGIVHIGVGGFHRAHLAYYVHQLRQLGEASEWEICGIGLRQNDQKLHDIFKKQDHLYTLMVQHPDGKKEAEVIGSIVDFKMGTDSPEAVITRMAAPETKIVSLTITEGGYNFNPNTGEFNFENQQIQHELAHPDDPKTVYGFLTASLKRRRDEGLPAFTVLSCDNIEHNGNMIQKMLLAFAKAQDPTLAQWIEKEVSFPNSMVDRITPVTTEEDIKLLAETYGVEDEWPVTCEPFIQWVVEDNFSNGRPAFEKVGVKFVPDVVPYEKMKLRLLNAGHSVLGLLGVLHGHPTIDVCVQDELFAQYLRAFFDKEATPVLGEIKGINLADYKDSLLERFGNPNIKDSVDRICSESSAKLPKFLIATIQENLAAGGSIKYATLVLVAWCYYSDKQENQNGQKLVIQDEMKEELYQAAKKTTEDALSFIKLESIFGNLIDNKRFTDLYTEMVNRFYNDVDIKKYMQELL
ncbi:mannitol dehydrogenase family protein [uncultured Dokdonia sp.]|uniref:mannitol dehydrogenase family protein n=1 Tax=uncultured Dokdonia sp. TaxID=575653 RepID=UPI00262273A5|nr:mannitol dehydrogenase family protein [uncultured Dokdonia sp.]